MLCKLDSKSMLCGILHWCPFDCHISDYILDDLLLLILCIPTFICSYLYLVEGIERAAIIIIFVKKGHSFVEVGDVTDNLCVLVLFPN